MPKIVDAQQYRQELLAKCFDLFAQEGYTKVTTRQIAKELGVSTGTLYHYFPSKQALFEQLAEQISLQDVTIIKNIDKNQDIRQRITSLGQILLKNQDYLLKQAVIWLDFRQNCSTKDIRSNPLFQKVDLRYEQAISELLDLKDSRIAKFIWTLIDGILLAQVDSDGSSLATEIELLTQMLIAYFEKQTLV